jgi:hypothetical protein
MGDNSVENEESVTFSKVSLISCEKLVGVDCNVSPKLLMKEKKVKKIIVEKSHIA